MKLAQVLYLISHKSSRLLFIFLLVTLKLQAQPSWQAITTPSVNIENITVARDNESQLYLSNTTTGLYISTDGGGHWIQRLTNGAPCRVVADPSGSRKLYASGNYRKGQLFSSTDAGLTWALIGEFPDPISAIVVGRDGAVFAAPRNTSVTSGVYKSTDGGGTWKHYAFPTNYLNLICWDLQEDPKSGYLFVGTEIANHPQPYKPPIFRSKDRGVTWEDITGIIPWHVICIEITVDQKVYALTEGAGLYISPDFGDHWERKNVPFWLSLLADPMRPGVLYGGTHTYGGSPGGLFRSTDGGQTWATFGLSGKVISDISLTGSGTGLYACSYGSGLFRTELPLPPPPSVALPLPVDTTQACPGFYIADVALAPGAKPGIWGVEVLTTAGKRELSGGLNFGGAVDANAQNAAWGAFNIANPTQESQEVRLTLNAQVLPTAGYSAAKLALQARILDVNKNPVGQAISGSPPLNMTRVLAPGFYSVEVTTLAGSPRATFQLAAETGFVGRAGGGFQGGAVVGGYLNVDAAGQSLHGFAAFCISEAQSVQFKTYNGADFATAGAGHLVLTVYDSKRNIVWQSP